MAESSVDLDALIQRGYRFALSLAHDTARADDLLQDAWFSILKARGPWNHKYLFTTIRNRFIDQCRRDKIVTMQPIVEGDGPSEEEAERSWGDRALLEVNGTLETAMGRLRPEERSVLYLSAVEGYSAQAIAELLNWPRGTVLSMCHRAKAKLRDWSAAPQGSNE